MKVIPELILCYMSLLSVYTDESAERVSMLNSVNTAYPVPLGLEERSLVSKTTWPYIHFC